MKSGETVRFSAQAEDRDDALAYVCNVDGARMAEGERFDLKPDTPGARQRVEVAIVDRAGLSERRSWEIAVEAPLLPPLAIRAANPRSLRARSWSSPRASTSDEPWKVEDRGEKPAIALKGR